MNSLAGGVAGAYGRFDLDYWRWRFPRRCAASRIELTPKAGVAGESTARAGLPGWREQLAGVMFRRNWIAETDPHKATT